MSDKRIDELSKQTKAQELISDLKRVFDNVARFLDANSNNEGSMYFDKFDSISDFSEKRNLQETIADLSFQIDKMKIELQTANEQVVHNERHYQSAVRAKKMWFDKYQNANQIIEENVIKIYNLECQVKDLKIKCGEPLHDRGFIRNPNYVYTNEKQQD